MADDRMKNDDAQRNMGGAKDQDYGQGQQTPGRSGQKGQGGQQAGGQGGSQQSNYGQGQKKTHDMEDDEEFGGGSKGQGGNLGRGGQNR